MAATNQKCYFINNSTKEKHVVQYNPESMPYSRSAKFAEIVSPGMAYPLIQFTGGNTREVTIKLMYQDPTGKKVKTARNFFEALLPPEKNMASFTRPPSFTFAYGYFVKKYVLTSLDVSDNVMSTGGLPTMTVFTLTMKQIGA